LSRGRAKAVEPSLGPGGLTSLRFAADLSAKRTKECIDESHPSDTTSATTSSTTNCLYDSGGARTSKVARISKHGGVGGEGGEGGDHDDGDENDSDDENGGDDSDESGSECVVCGKDEHLRQLHTGKVEHLAVDL